MSIYWDDDTGRLLKRAGVGLIIAASLTVSACQSTGTSSGSHGNADPITTGSVGDSHAMIEETTRLAQAWEADESSVELALSYAEALKNLGSHAQAAQVLRQTMMLNPDDGRLLGEYGRSLANAGQFAEASQVLQKAISLGNADWELYSTQGTVLDRMGEHERAREYYQAALQARPNEPKILNNLAMSHALGGAPEEAERILREGLQNGASGHSATVMRQNLALVLGLQGRFDEARQTLAQELPPEQVEANLAYIRAMLSQPNTWQQLSAGG